MFDNNNNSTWGSMFYEKEKWIDINGFEGVYQISNIGNLRSKDRYVNGKCNSKRFQSGKIQKPEVTKKGYLRYTLSISKTISVRKLAHVLVAEYFLKRYSEKNQVNHINGIKSDNRFENLEWCTGSENVIHAFRNGLSKPNYANKGKKGSDCSSSKKIAVFNKGVLIGKTDSIIEASIKYNTPVGVISRCVNGKVKNPRGYLFKIIQR